MEHRSQSEIRWTISSIMSRTILHYANIRECYTIRISDLGYKNVRPCKYANICSNDGLTNLGIFKIFKYYTKY